MVKTSGSFLMGRGELPGGELIQERLYAIGQLHSRRLSCQLSYAETLREHEGRLLRCTGWFGTSEDASGSLSRESREHVSPGSQAGGKHSLRVSVWLVTGIRSNKSISTPARDA